MCLLLYVDVHKVLLCDINGNYRNRSFSGNFLFLLFGCLWAEFLSIHESSCLRGCCWYVEYKIMSFYEMYVILLYSFAQPHLYPFLNIFFSRHRS